MLFVYTQVTLPKNTKKTMNIRTYSELRKLQTFSERFEYLKLGGSVGRPTFGFDRYINQRFYTSAEWKRVRETVIARDLGLDLGVPDHDIHDKILIHHMNPMLPEDIIREDETILDPEFLISTSHQTHNAIHYGAAIDSLIPNEPRSFGDTKLW